MKKIAGNLLLIICAVVFCISSYRIYDYFHQNRVGKQNTENLKALAVRTDFEEKTQDQERADSNAVNELEAEITILEQAPIAVDFTSLKSVCPDIVGWLYCPDTLINYPLVQGRDNDYYLDRLTDGTYNALGTIFLDYRSNEEFSDQYSVVYGHNMNTDAMFGTLDEYKNQSYYDAHPVLYLLTPAAAYRIDLAAGLLISGYNELYVLPKAEKDVEKIVTEALTNSTFSANAEYEPEKNYIVLSTCSYEFDEARYIVIGTMTEIEQAPER